VSRQRNLVPVGDGRNVVEPVTEQNVVEVYTSVGAPGPAGPQGPAGPPAEAEDVSYVHEQGFPASVWDITHGLGWYPNVTVVDSAGTVVEGEIGYPGPNGVVLTFSSAFSGRAYLS
jgi:hypothetical protein